MNFERQNPNNNSLIDKKIEELKELKEVKG